MDVERAVASLHERLDALAKDVAVIKVQMDNHISGLTEDVRELKADVRETGRKVERLFGVVMSRPQANSNSVDFRTVSGWLVSALLGLAFLVFEFVLRR